MNSPRPFQSPIANDPEFANFSQANQALLMLMNDDLDDDFELKENEPPNELSVSTYLDNSLPSASFAGPRTSSDERRIRYLLDQLRQVEQSQTTNHSQENTVPWPGDAKSPTKSSQDKLRRIKERRRKAKSFAPGMPLEDVGGVVDELHLLLFGSVAAATNGKSVSRSSEPSSASHSRRASEQFSMLK